MNILAVDTSTQTMGVAISKKNVLCGEIVTNIAKGHSVRLMPAINYLMDEVGITPEQLDKIVVAKGPGSYTGVRIGLSTAKAMAWALEIPIVGISSLEVLAHQSRESNLYICPFFDARRDAVYTGLYKWENAQIVSVIEDQYMQMSDWLAQLKEMKKQVVFLSPDLTVHQHVIEGVLGKQGHIPPNIYHVQKPSNLILAGYHRPSDNVHTLAPQYLRITEAEANWLKKQKETDNND